jgi:hypothetical protein
MVICSADRNIHRESWDPLQGYDAGSRSSCRRVEDNDDIIRSKRRQYQSHIHFMTIFRGVEHYSTELKQD